MNPIQALLHFLYGSTPAEFKSAFDLSESVTRLRTATRRSAFGVLAQQAATGPVSESRVRLQRVIPMVGNSFKPYFVGRFEQRDDGVHLIGRFTMLRVVKAFITFWLGVVLVPGIAATISQPRNWQLVLFSLGMFAAGIALMCVGKWLGRNDAAWLSNVIRGAIGTPLAEGLAPAATTPTAPLIASATPPTVLLVTALVLLLFGFGSIWQAASDVASWHANFGQEAVTTHFSTSWARFTTSAYGLAMVVMAIGIYRRQMWAWRGVLVVIITSWFWGIYQMSSLPEIPDSIVFRVIFGVLSLGITAYWGWWWYAQRRLFPTDTA